MTRHRALSTAAALMFGALTAAALLSGCSTTSSESSEDIVAEPSGPQDCDSFLALGETERQQAFGDRTLPVYGANGVQQVPVSGIYEEQCPAHVGEAYVLSNIDSDASSPSCAVFLGLTPDQQSTWVSQLLGEEYWGLAASETTPESLSAGCTQFGVDNMVRLSNYLVDMTSDRMSWSVQTRLGYSWNAVLAVGVPLTGDAVVPLDKSYFDGTTTVEVAPYMPGSACGFDPATDAVIPLALLMRSMTEGSDSPMSAAWSLSVERGAEPIVTAYLEADYTSGPTCSEAADSSSTAKTSVRYEQPGDGEVFSPSSYSVILKNWISPRYPDGATSDLSSFVLSSVDSSPSSDDPVVTSTVASMTLAGATVGG
ncbi:MAG: hypothetical protein EPO52_12385 [Herbiconiux sp.]|uniref:hypothetical protein n=1 Tax=Herbiconiux sp. TaxID=1871186 RepID=UPI001214A127|nr:hypothetical protein [Herbiconiux sp.]TAJ47293.1 MAG: hypothetical protein EPO52_12385 [Herbiconiux sp.]